MRKITLVLLALALFLQSCDKGTNIAAIEYDGDLETQHVEPMFWWVGMNNPEVEVMIHQENIADYSVTVADNRVTVVADENSDNPNYKFVTLNIANATAGKIPLVFEKDGKKFKLEYELKERNVNPAEQKGLSPKDVIYLIFPDRFANADTTNDTVAGMLEGKSDASLGRHGGDLQGVISKLDYLSDLGITAVLLFS